MTAPPETDPTGTPPAAADASSASAGPEPAVLVALPSAGASGATAPDSERELVGCRFCAQPATALCPRCESPYCADHGGVTCAACSNPLTGVPSGGLVRVAALTLAGAALLALALLIVRPRLPSESPAGGAAIVPVPTTAAPANNQGAPGGAPATAPGGAAPTAAPGSRSYTVQPGDTLGNIAVQFGTTVEAIVAANPGVNPNNIQVGRVLTIPPAR